MVNSKVFWGIVTAAAAGAVIGMLFAPEEGTQTRKKIKKKTNSLASELIDALEKSKQKAGETADDLKAKGEQYKNDFKDKAEEVKEDAADEFDKYN
ncbi:YtxH domain-containing protein [Dyadobacter subterraneus]|uniref:YtxH domain-containing protein n=1 Tax=Dyadobacter subterraneus TaxID=2773304 RepID=A0ABR9WHK6_9BACT|nr:YtxH domain-containing protein [Dyadobacter subterraneus]MBE9464920.1 YtxH domain-containing protein [Dyadobacter subterraneus]